MPQMNSARENAFKIEALTILESSKSTINKLIKSSEISVNNNTSSCKKDNTYCFSLNELKKLGLYKSGNESYIGKVEIDLVDVDNPQYILYLKKSEDLKMMFASTKNFANMASVPVINWTEEYELCNCNG